MYLFLSSPHFQPQSRLIFFTFQATTALGEIRQTRSTRWGKFGHRFFTLVGSVQNIWEKRRVIMMWKWKMLIFFQICNDLSLIRLISLNLSNTATCLSALLMVNFSCCDEGWATTCGAVKKTWLWALRHNATGDPMDPIDLAFGTKLSAQE